MDRRALTNSFCDLGVCKFPSNAVQPFICFSTVLERINRGKQDQVLLAMLRVSVYTFTNSQLGSIISPTPLSMADPRSG